MYLIYKLFSDASVIIVDIYVPVKHNLESSVETIQKMKLSQEDITRQHENEKKQMLEKINRLQGSLTATDQEIQILRVKKIFIFALTYLTNSFKSMIFPLTRLLRILLELN